MNPQLLQEIDGLHANICDALADPKRIAILYALREGATTVNQLGDGGFATSHCLTTPQDLARTSPGAGAAGGHEHVLHAQQPKGVGCTRFIAGGLE